MGATVKDPRYNVLSTRLSDCELEEIDSLAADSQTSRSEYVRAIIRSVLDWRHNG